METHIGIETKVYIFISHTNVYQTASITKEALKNQVDRILLGSMLASFYSWYTPKLVQWTHEHSSLVGRLAMHGPNSIGPFSPNWHSYWVCRSSGFLAAKTSTQHWKGYQSSRTLPGKLVASWLHQIPHLPIPGGGRVGEKVIHPYRKHLLFWRCAWLLCQWYLF